MYPKPDFFLLRKSPVIDLVSKCYLLLGLQESLYIFIKEQAECQGEPLEPQSGFLL